MAKWPSLDPVQQHDLLTEITRQITEALPHGWRELMIDYRHLGRHIDVATGLTGADGAMTVWDPPAEVWRMFQRLRGGMYVENEGTWFSCRYGVEPPGKFRIQYNIRNEPDFPAPPSPEEFAVEQERFPRTPPYQPPWFKEALARAEA
ncbi:hypothetical protein [Actinomadura rubrisoli]|uniref:Uncharacterized protein n=1 Tax=Actinomadura rubrisoli TaxID=2530368 RepID=A0A4R5BKD3_9ACTN|nr:hypothetical protein [Actinomadura rubrisoli]TDD87121.1 hypothetical protein E1298_16650 [Actinomadura rubrisoli]